MLDHVMTNCNLDCELPSDLGLEAICVAMAFAWHDTILGTTQTMRHRSDASPSVECALRQEVDSVRGGDGSSPVTQALLQKLHRCRTCWLESLRVTPPLQTTSSSLAADAPVHGLCTGSWHNHHAGVSVYYEVLSRRGQRRVSS
ncbi:unnamed protein product [Prorocentrum cordatum]|uniref:Uncharacterized protein n=1 Tax=Prorocentrum cordatum TaxID=2364126 RepID=A0ABN9T3C9_9DINO|nr:unnamed protein product [Polarella glacialis]